jgi:hypothetical protein
MKVDWFMHPMALYGTFAVDPSTTQNGALEPTAVAGVLILFKMVLSILQVICYLPPVVANGI